MPRIARRYRGARWHHHNNKAGPPPCDRRPSSPDSLEIAGRRVGGQVYDTDDVLEADMSELWEVVQETGDQD
jgi:hypothetical protein